MVKEGDCKKNKNKKNNNKKRNSCTRCCGKGLNVVFLRFVIKYEMKIAEKKNDSMFRIISGL